jgi:hypothetical protein
MALSFRVEDNRPVQCPQPTPEFLRAHVASLHALLLAHGEEVPWPRAASGAAFYCSLALTLPRGFAPPPRAAPAQAADEEGEEEEAAPGSSGTLPSAAQRRLELRVVRRAGGVPVWESPLVTEQRSQAFLVARAGEGAGAGAGAGEEEEEGEGLEEGALGVTAWRVPPIDAMLLAARALEALLPEEAATAPPLRAFRRRAFDLEEQRARVRVGGAQWTRAEQLKLLAALRAQVRGAADGSEMTVQHKAIVAAFAQGELAMGGGEEEEGVEGGGGGAGAAPAAQGGAEGGGQ